MAIAGVKPGQVVEEPEVIDDRPLPIHVNLQISGKPDIIYNRDVIDVEAKPASGPERPSLPPPRW